MEQYYYRVHYERLGATASELRIAPNIESATERVNRQTKQTAPNTAMWQHSQRIINAINSGLDEVKSACVTRRSSIAKSESNDKRELAERAFNAKILEYLESIRRPYLSDLTILRNVTVIAKAPLHEIPYMYRHQTERYKVWIPQFSKEVYSWLNLAHAHRHQ